MNKNKLHIANPCTEDFESMNGEGFRRFCGKCEKHVHDLSDLTPRQARDLFSENQNSNICVVYRYDSLGKIKFREKSYPRPGRLQLIGLKKLIAAAALVPVLATLPACDVSQDNQPEIVQLEDVPCGYANENTFTPMDEILAAEQRLLESLRELLGFEPEIEMVAGEMMVDPNWDPQPIEISLDLMPQPSSLQEVPFVPDLEVTEVEQAIEVVPEPEPRHKRMGRISIPPDLHLE